MEGAEDSESEERKLDGDDAKNIGGATRAFLLQFSRI